MSSAIWLVSVETGLEMDSGITGALPTTMRTAMVSAVVLGMGRAIGETMAVLMVVGNAPVIPESISSPVSTLTSQIALDMSYSSGLHRTALFGMGVVLFIVSASLVGFVRLLSKMRKG